jgi:hypothetical protein
MRTEFFFLGKNQKVFGPISSEELARMKTGGELANYTWILKVGESAWKVLDSAPPILPQFTPAPSAENRATAAVKSEPVARVVSMQDDAAPAPAPTNAAEAAPPLPEFSAPPIPPQSNPKISRPASRPVELREEPTVEVNLRAQRLNKNSSYRDSRIQGASNDAFRAILYDSRNAVTAWVSEAAHHGCEIRADIAGADPLFVDKSGAILNLHEVATGRTVKVAVHVDQVFRRDQHWVYKVRWTTVPAIFEESQAS